MQEKSHFVVIFCLEDVPLVLLYIEVIGKDPSIFPTYYIIFGTIQRDLLVCTHITDN